MRRFSNNRHVESANSWVTRGVQDGQNEESGRKCIFLPPVRPGNGRGSLLVPAVPAPTKEPPSPGGSFAHFQILGITEASIHTPGLRPVRPTIPTHAGSWASVSRVYGLTRMQSERGRPPRPVPLATTRRDACRQEDCAVRRSRWPAQVQPLLPKPGLRWRPFSLRSEAAGRI